MVEIKIWNDIYKSLPDDGEQVIVDLEGSEEPAIWHRTITSFFLTDAGVKVNPFHYLDDEKHCRYWRREIFSSFNGNIKEGDMCMNKKTMSFLRQVVMTVLGIALGGVIFGLPGALVVGLVMVIKKWPK